MSERGFWNCMNRNRDCLTKSCASCSGFKARHGLAMVLEDVTSRRRNR